MRGMLRACCWFLVLAVAVPVVIGAGIGVAQGWPANWRAAKWGTSGLLPAARSVPQAQVIILATRTGRWKSIFAEHLSIVFKRAGDPDWTRFDVVGWGSPVRRNAFAADAFWYGNRPRTIFQREGPAAQALIPKVEASILQYPFQAAGTYSVWPGPNSNSFVSWVVRHTEGFDAELPPEAVGKDWLGPGMEFIRAPSNTGFTLSAAGLIGFTLAREEGVELHLLGGTIGIDPNDLAVKLPALGKLSLLP